MENFTKKAATFTIIVILTMLIFIATGCTHQTCPAYRGSVQKHATERYLK